MSEAVEKPGLIERIGAAVNATDLSPIAGREGAVELVTALGLTQINRGAVEHEERDQVEIDPNAELAATLLRLKVGHQHREAQRAVYQLVHWVRQQKAYTRWKLRSGHGVLQAFVTRAISEWLWATCDVCSGIAWQGLQRDSLVSKLRACKGCRGTGYVLYLPSKPGKLSAPETATREQVMKICPDCLGNRRIMTERVRSVTPRECKACNGTGRRRPHDGERARALGVSLAAYQRHWLRRFDWLLARLDQLDHDERNLLQSSLGRRITRIP